MPQRKEELYHFGDRIIIKKRGILRVGPEGIVEGLFDFDQMPKVNGVPISGTGSINDSLYLSLDGGTLRGDLIVDTNIDVAGDINIAGDALLGRDPTAPLGAATKLYVDVSIATLALYQGVWEVALNTPDLNTVPKLNGYMYLASTVDPQVDETAPPGIPGIGGTSIPNSSQIIWNEALGIWQVVVSGSLTKMLADTLYLSLDGGTLNGDLIVNNGGLMINGGNFGMAGGTMVITNGGELILDHDPIQAFDAATKQYVDTQNALYLPLTGGTLTGPGDLTVNGNVRINGNIGLTVLNNINVAGTTTLGRDPTAPLQAATKQYVDAADSLKVAKAGDTMSGALTVSNIVTADGFNCPIDDSGYGFYGGGLFYKKSGTGVIIRLSSGNQELAIENNNGTNARDVLTALTGVRKTGDTMTGLLTLSGPPTAGLHAATKAYVDTQVGAGGPFLLVSGGAMTGGLNFGSVAQANPQDTSRHISLWGGNATSGTFGFSITDGTLNYNVPASNTHSFRVGGTERLRIDGVTNVMTNINYPNLGQGLTMPGGVALFAPSSGNLQVNAGTFTVQGNETVTGTLFANNGQIQLRAINNNDNTAAQFGLTRANGEWLAWMQAYQSGYFLNPQGIFELWTNNGGWSSQRVFRTNTNAPPDTLFDGNVYARGVLLSSDSDLKDEITPVDPVTSAEAFDVLNPVRFKWKPPEVDDPDAPGGKRIMPLKDPDRYYWGFVADEIKEFVPDAVYEDSEGLLSYDPVSILAVTASQLQSLKQELADLKSRLP
jgi:hypothetical protein